MAVLSKHDTSELLALSIGPACHELRSPLAVVYGFAKMLEGNEELDERTTRYVNAIVNSSQRLDDLLDQLSKLGRIAGGRLHPTIETVSLRSVIDALCSTSQNCGRVVVEQQDDVRVQADEGWLTEAFHGIIDSVCFEEAVEATLTWSIDHDEVAVHFMPRSTFPLVDTDPSKSGLALALARMRVVAMGGSLDGQADRITVTIGRATA